MTMTITAMYATDKQARDAATALRKEFTGDRVTLARKDAGKAAVTVKAESSTTQKAIRILNEQSPLNKPESSQQPDNPASNSGWLGIPSVYDYTPRVRLWRNATPLSDLLNIPVLWKRTPNVRLSQEAAPFSKMLGLPTIIRNEPSRVW